MNRLIIIGNGFDLAHGLPTGYCDFIEDYWGELIVPNYKGFLVEGYINYDDNLINLSLNFTFLDYYSRQKLLPEMEYLNSYYSIKEFVMKYISPYGLNCEETFRVNYKNDFFKNINERNSKNWVDIENEYYYQLKKIVKSKCLDTSKSEEYWKDQQRQQVVKLNKEFDSIKLLFESYLNEKVLREYNFYDYSDPAGDCLKFPEIIRPKFFKPDSNELFKFLEEFPISHQNKLEKLFTQRDDLADYICQVTILNFNYTPTANKYIRSLVSNEIGVRNIHIHGFVKDRENPINFGFGDEMDDDYKNIENIDDNEYLKNFKSFQYLHTSNYKELLDFIDSEQFQVYILGHSCGLSDRTLLNTIFEHQNCISIKVYYHKKEDGSDNYTELTQNISRHFNKKKLMREKIVNKTLCQPLPQIKLPRKEEIPPSSE